MKPFTCNTQAYGPTSTYLAYFVTIFSILYAKKGHVLDLTIRKSLMNSAKNVFLGMAGKETILEQMTELIASKEVHTVRRVCFKNLC